MARTNSDTEISGAASNGSGTGSVFPAANGRASSRGGLAVAGAVTAAMATAAIVYVAITGGAVDVAANVLARGYGRALADVDTSWSGPPPGNLWLSGIGEQPIAMRKAVTIGDRITVGNNSRTDVFEVVGLGQIDGEPLGFPAMRIQVVTARVDGHASGETVRFLFAVDDPTPVTAQPKPDKVL